MFILSTIHPPNSFTFTQESIRKCSLDHFLTISMDTCCFYQAGMILTNIICRNLVTLIRRPPDDTRGRLARLCLFQWYGLISFLFLRIVMQEVDRRNEPTLNVSFTLELSCNNSIFFSILVLVLLFLDFNSHYIKSFFFFGLI